MMRRSVIASLLACVLLVPATVAAPAPNPTLGVFAAASLAGAFGEIAREFERAHPGVRVRLNLAGTQVLVAQIDQGARADVFASADAQWMATLKKHGHVDGEPQLFAHNRLVVIVPRTNPARIGKLADLARPGVKFVIGVESVPVGRYGREMLAKLGALPGFGDDFARKALANVVSQEENVKGVVGKVQLGEADAGVCYRSDVTPSVARLVRLIEIPAEANVIADYPIAVVAGASHADLAREFVAKVLAADGQRALERNGLIPATPATP
jgi:molybdate transport system substrate-binding protein